VLKSIVVLIGLVVVLLAFSMAATVITTAITTAINSRGKHLRRGDLGPAFPWERLGLRTA